MAKKDGKAKLPKKVGGVKLPKQLRKSASVMAEIAQNPVARDVVSAALVAGATALAKRRTKDHAAPGAAKKPDGEFGNLIAQGQELGSIISQGINAFVGALLKPADKMPAAPTEPASAKSAVRKTVTKKAAAAKPVAAKSATAKRAPVVKPRAKSEAKAKPAS